MQGCKLGEGGGVQLRLSEHADWHFCVYVRVRLLRGGGGGQPASYHTPQALLLRWWPSLPLLNAHALFGCPGPDAPAAAAA